MTIKGPLLDWSETGTEGVVWCVENEETSGYEAIEPLRAGDHLTVFDRVGNQVWAGHIQCDIKTGWTQSPYNPSYGKQSALGYWIHWVQEGFAPDDWARFFIRSPEDRYRGVLVRERDGDVSIKAADARESSQ